MATAVLGCLTVIAGGPAGVSLATGTGLARSTGRPARRAAARTAAGPAAAGVCTAPPVTVVVDETAGHQAISPLIYGINGNDIPNTSGAAGWPQTTAGGGFSSVLAATKATLVRQGGDSYTDFNWEIGDSNHGSDYDYSNFPLIPDGATSTAAQHAPGGAVLPTVEAAQASGAASLVTVPIAGYVAADELDQNTDVRDSGPNYLQTRFKQDEPTDPDPLTTTPVTTDAYVYQNQFVYFLEHTDPSANILYELDNEPNDWQYVHPEVHPDPVTYAGLTSLDLTYAAAIKGVDPNALVLGPVLDGYQGQQDPTNGADGGSDYNEYGPYLPYYLKAVDAADQAAGQTLINVLDLHWYPQVTPDIFNTQDTPAIVAAREQAPRSLWDPSYIENSWITQANGGQPIDLLPTVEGEIAQDNPGMGLGITEWNYGGGADISGGIASADTLGIFGKYGLDVASFWPQFSPQEDYSLGAFKVFENYDGQGGHFGDTEVSATDSDTADTSVYASVEAADPSQATIVAINKEDVPQPTTIQIKGAQTGTATVYTLTSANSSPQPAAGLQASAPNTFDYTMPAQSVSMIVPAPAGPTPVLDADAPPPAVVGSPYSYTFTATGTPPPSFALASGTLPAGLSLNAATGVLSGTPTTLGSSSFKLTATNTAGSATSPTLTVVASTAAAPRFTADAPPGSVPWLGSYSYAFAATGSPPPTYAVASGSLPPGLCLDPTTGLLSGTPSTVGSSTFTLAASNGISPAATTGPLGVSVAPPPTGSVLAWGNDSENQLGPGNRQSAGLPEPVALPPGVQVKAVAAGLDHSLALSTGGQIYAWGDNICGELGNGQSSGCNLPLNSITPTLVRFPKGTPGVHAIAAGGQDSMALTADGNVWTWGNDGSGELGDGAPNFEQPLPIKVDLGAADGTVVAIAANAYSDVALTASGNVYTWGDNTSGALGNGTTTESATPVAVELGPYAGTIVAIAAGGSQAGHDVALSGSGSVIDWGYNARGQLGNGTTTDSDVPVAVSPPAGMATLPTMEAIGAGSYSSYAITTTGALYAWGDNGFGELGTGDNNPVPVPVLVGPAAGQSSLPPVSSVTGGDFYTLLDTTAGALYGIGYGGDGQLGTGDGDATTYVTTPSLLPAQTSLAGLGANSNFALAVVGPPPTGGGPVTPGGRRAPAKAPARRR